MEKNMALKLTRKAGESIILKYSDTNGYAQKVRILVRKIKQNGYVELDYYSSVEVKVLSSAGLIESVNSNEHTIINHTANDVLILNARGEIGFKNVLRFGIDAGIGSQLGMWFDAPADVIIIRDELENAA
jgi:sRNA-binding carbon storage regulator CsrA